MLRHWRCITHLGDICCQSNSTAASAACVDSPGRQPMCKREQLRFCDAWIPHHKDVELPAHFATFNGLQQFKSRQLISKLVKQYCDLSIYIRLSRVSSCSSQVKKPPRASDVNACDWSLLQHQLCKEHITFDFPPNSRHRRPFLTSSSSQMLGANDATNLS